MKLREGNSLAAVNVDMSGSCKECGCQCHNYGNQETLYLDLHQQIAQLHSQLQRSNTHISNVEQELIDSRNNVDIEVYKTREEHVRLRERYDRLLESHKKMQKINHDLEDKLLKLVSQFEAEKLALQQEVSSMMDKLVESRRIITELDEETERYRNDCNMAVQLLQCKPSNFVAHRLNTLPLDLQERVKQHMTRDQIIAAETSNNAKQAESRLIHVPIATFPPTAMVYSLNQSIKQDMSPLPSNDANNSKGFVPMSLIARVLSHKDDRRTMPRTYLCMRCKSDIEHLDKGCQVDLLSRMPRCVEISRRPSDSGKCMIHTIHSKEIKSNAPVQSRRESNFSSSSTETEI